MRCLLKVAIPVETGNAAISDGSLPKIIESILADMKPEAAYFAGDNGKRTGFIFFDLKDASQIPPWQNRGFWLSMPTSSCIPL